MNPSRTHLCDECDSKLVAMNVEDVYEGKAVYCNGTKCPDVALSGTVLHCPNEHDWCCDCAVSKLKAIKNEPKQQNESITQNEGEIEVLDAVKAECKIFDIDDDIKLKPKTNSKCPISLKEMTNPYKSTRCGHIFEKDAVLNYMQNYRKKPNKRKDSSVPCPIPGCSKTIKEEYLEAVNKKKRRRSSFDINCLPPAKKIKLAFIDLSED